MYTKIVKNNTVDFVDVESLVENGVKNKDVILAINGRTDHNLLFLTKLSYEEKYYNWLIAFDDFTGHNSYQSNGIMDLDDALDWALERNFEIYIVKNTTDLIEVLRKVEK